MLFVYRSNSQKELSKRLCSVLADTTENILQPDWIVIGNYDISRWIELQIMQIQGISANLKFFSPNQFLQQLFQLLPKKFLSNKLLLSEEDWNWKILELLLQFYEEKNKFNSYLQKQNPKELYFLALMPLIFLQSVNPANNVIFTNHFPISFRAVLKNLIVF